MMNQSSQREREQESIRHCYWHPNVETRLSCSRCGKYICPQCMVQAPVGIRCRECGRPSRMPTYEVQPSFMARALATGAGVAIIGGILWAVFNSIFGGIPFLPSIIAIGVGYAAGELISLSVNRKRGTSLAWIAAGSVVAAFLISWLVNPYSFGIFGLLFIAIGVYAAVERVRR